MSDCPRCRALEREVAQCRAIIQADGAARDEVQGKLEAKCAALTRERHELLFLLEQMTIGMELLLARYDRLKAIMAAQQRITDTIEEARRT